MNQLQQVIECLKALRKSNKLPEHTIERVVIERCISELEAVTELVSNLEGQLEEADEFMAEMQEQLDQMMPI